MKNLPIVFLLCLGLLLFPTSSYGNTVHVPDDYPTIQEAIFNVDNGGTVLVADGIWRGEGNKNIQFLPYTEITVKSENGPKSCIIDCEGEGSGFYMRSLYNYRPAISGFTITNASNSGIYCRASSPRIENCIITGNTGPEGGGIYFMSSASYVRKCLITNNRSTTKGGGIYSFLHYNGHSPVITNCIISNNAATEEGGGVYAIYDYLFTLTNCTVINNSSQAGGGVATSPEKNWNGVSIYNSIVWGNSPDATHGSFQEILNSDIAGGHEGAGNIDANPLFVGNGDYRLRPTSPCVNTGDNDAPDLPDTDKDGKPRIIGGTVDMGAYEYAPSDFIAYVALDGVCNGKTPCYSNIQDAVTNSGADFTIRIAQGHYQDPFTLNNLKILYLQGGWDSTFITQTANTTFIKAPKAPKGSLRLTTVTIKP